MANSAPPPDDLLDDLSPLARQALTKIGDDGSLDALTREELIAYFEEGRPGPIGLTYQEKLDLTKKLLQSERHLHLVPNEAQMPEAPLPFAEMLHRYGDGLQGAPQLGDVDGGSFLFDIPAGVPAVWGDAEGHVLWAEGEAMMIAGPQGVGKTTDLGQLTFGLCGVPGFETLYGLPVRPLPPGKRVVYLALDRPRQIARCLRRLVAPEHRALLEERLVVWQGPLPFNVLREPNRLAEWLLELRAGAVAVDSLKDLAGKLSDEEVGATLNGAFQRCIAEGIEVVTAHHNRKANAENRRPKTLADVHGSENLTRGLGSVICLFGAAGDDEVELSHLKQPAEVVGPFVVARDHETGRSRIAHEGELEKSGTADRDRAVRNWYATNGGPGTAATLDDLVGAGLGSKNTVRASLKRLVAEGWLEERPGDSARHEPTLWVSRPTALQNPTALQTLPPQGVGALRGGRLEGELESGTETRFEFRRRPGLD